MVTSYDSYDYPRYWQGREYENLAEKMVLRKLLKRVPKGKIIDIGGGYGRLAKIYAPLFKRSFLIDPSIPSGELDASLLNCGVFIYPGKITLNLILSLA